MSVSATRVEHHHHTPEGHDDTRKCLHMVDSDNDECSLHQERDHPTEALIITVGPRDYPIAFLASLDRVAAIALRDYLDEWLTATQAEAPATTIPDTPDEAQA